MKKHKSLGQVFTPEWIVNEILNLLKYNSSDILDKFILEPASGNGVFLLEIVKRYIQISKEKKIKKDLIIKNLEKYIYGFELDPVEHQKSITKLNQFINKELGNNTTVNWQIIKGDTLYLYKNFYQFFDFIVGNPPYIRIHHLDNETRKRIKENFMFCEGTIDIYLSFFEMGLKMLKPNGKLGYITPNSYLHNSSYKSFREFLKNHKLVETLIDFKANKVFKGFSTYTAISILNKKYNQNYFNYKELINNKIKKVCNVNYKDLNNKDWSFANASDTDFIKKLNLHKKNTIQDFFNVQYGFATLRDKIFISKIEKYNEQLVYFNNYLLEKSILKKIVKGSKYKGDINTIQYIIFPYHIKNKKYEPYTEEELSKKFPFAYKYLLSNKTELKRRDLDKHTSWYEFGRSQGIQTMHNEKIVVSTLMYDKVNFYKLPKDIFIYSGIFITKKKRNTKWQSIEHILSSNEFKRFIKITGKDFSGGYKSITSKQIKNFNFT